MVAALISIMIEIFNQETSHKILIEKKVARLKKELGREDLRSCYDTEGLRKQSLKQTLANGLIRPLKMLFLSPIVLLLTIYISFTYGTLYLLFTTIPTVFEETYGFNIGLTGLVYLGLGSGTTLGWLIITFLSDKSVIRQSKKNNGVFEPEMRLWMTIWFSWLLPITFFWYGWGAQYKVHYMSSIISLMPFGVGIMGLFLPITTQVKPPTLTFTPLAHISQLPRGLLSHVRSLGYCCQYGATQSCGRHVAPRWYSNVLYTWSRVGQFTARLSLHPHDTSTSSVLQVWQEVTEDGEVQTLACLLHGSGYVLNRECPYGIRTKRHSDT